MNINELEGRELDLAVAEKVFDKPPSYYDCPHFDKHNRMLSFCSCPDLPHYSTDIVAAYQVEEWIKEMGFVDEYCWELIIIASTKKGDPPQQWYLVHATPEDRCRAALKAVEAE